MTATLSPTFDTLSWTWQGHTIRYTVQGSGRPVVLVHGFGASMGHWRHTIPDLVAAGYAVYAPDLLGFGASDKPAVDYDLTVWESLLQSFCQEVVREPAVFVGNSIGSLMSLMLAVRDPDAVAGLVLLNCAGGLNHRPSEMMIPFRWIMGAFTSLVTSPVTGPFLFNQVRQKDRIRSTLKQVYCNTAAIDDELVDLLHRPSCDPGAQKVFASILAAPAGTPPEELLPHLDQPILLMWGEKDPWTPIQRGHGFKTYVDPGVDYQFVGLPDTGHCPHDDRPDLVNPLMVEWLHQHH